MGVPSAAVACALMVLVVPVPRLAAGSSSLIQANSKLQRLGAWRIDVSPTLGGATGAFGRPTSCHGISLEDGSVVRWRGLGVKVLTATLGVIPQDKSSCTYEQMPVSVVTVTGRMWQTSLGLRIGDTARRLRVLYPRASFHAASRGEASPASSYWLVTRRADCLGDCTTRRITAPQLVAHTHAGRVVALIFPVGAQGE